MHSVNPPAKFHICHVPCPGRLWPQAGQTQGLKQKKPNPLKITSVSSMTLGCVLWTAQGSVCKSPAAATEPSELAGAEQSLGRAGTCWAPQSCTGAELLLPQLPGEPSRDAEVAALQQECRSPLKRKRRKGKERRNEKALLCFKPGCPSKSLGFLFPSLSSLILQPAQKGKQSPLEQTCQQQLYNRNNQTNMWLWLTRFSPQFYKSSPLPTILTHNIQ